MKLDLHTHSTLSHDGGIREEKYVYLLENRVLDCVAITDHNEIAFAKKLHDKLGKKIIVGEEIETDREEIIGLFLKDKIEPGLSLEDTVSQIQDQDGVVYIPHPFEIRRKGLTFEAMKEIADENTIIEAFNARSFSSKNMGRLMEFCQQHNFSFAASSDAHCIRGIGTAYAEVNRTPTKETIVTLLSKATYETRHAPLYTYLCPAKNKIRNTLPFK